MREWMSVLGRGSFPIFPDLTSYPALVIPCLGPFSNCLSCSYLHSPFISFPPDPPTQTFQLCPSQLLSELFVRLFPQFWQETFLYPILSPSLLLPFPSFPLTTANGSPWLHGICKHLQWEGAVQSDLFLILGAYLALLANTLCSAAWAWL